MEFSKKIIYASWLNALITTYISILLVYFDKDISSLYLIVLAVWTEVAGADAFYFWKAKNENIIKLGGKLQEVHDED